MSEMMSLPDVAMASSMCEVFQATVAARPDVVALRASDGGQAITWRAYGEQVGRIAAGLAGLGVRRGDTVALMLTNRPEFHLVDAAVMHLGATAFSVYNTFTAEQVAQLFTNAGNRIVVCERQFVARIREAADIHPVEHVVCVDPVDGMPSLDDLVAAADPGFDFESAWRAVTRDDVLALIFTSGTTGEPKGVELTHANILFSVAGKASHQQDVLGAGTEERVISYLPDANLANRFAAHYVPMATGATVTDVRDGRTVLDVFREVRPTTFMGVPMIWYKLKASIDNAIAGRRELAEWALSIGKARVRHELAGRPVPSRLAAIGELADREVLAPLRREFGIDELGFATSGGAPIAPEVLEHFLALGVRVCEVYGLTETAASGIGNDPRRIRRGTVGQPRPGVEASLGPDGELLLRSPGVMRGYRNDPGKTAEAIDADGWLHTGDIATIDAEGYVSIVDRKKDLIINSSGKNLSPANIENAIKLACPLLGSVVAIGDRRPHVVALLTLDPEQATAFADAHGIADRSPAALANDHRVQEAVADGVARGNAKLSRVEHVRAHTVLPVFWEANSDELTATTKVRRRIVNEKYAAEIDQLYTGGTNR
ncbi:long-chain fatty acid--CoA ligase [Saccharopolyspora sp. NPDC050642]|uniref:AMP-dependent synthetase/ligase n=1 Tax=Saccharopolyspora sp. NPDC050642 TaxID=3157099 RepID=UPI0033C8ADE5